MKPPRIHDLSKRSPNFRPTQKIRNKLLSHLSLALLAALFCLAEPIISTLAAAGALDPSFSGDGRLVDWTGRASDVVIQPDGRIVVAGTDPDNSRFAVARYNPDGSPDNSFGDGDGKVTTDIGFSDEGVNAVALQEDGKIVAVGTTWDGSGSQWGHFSLVRYDPDGSLDLTFGGGDGIVVTENLGTGWVAANAIAIQADGKIVAAGRTDYFLYDFPEMTVIRYNPDGSLDLPFGESGEARIPWGPGPFGGIAPQAEDATSVAIQPDGKIVAAGYSYGFWDFAVLARLKSDGSIDETFGGGDGIVHTDIGPGADVPHSAAIQSDGKIVTAGSSADGSNYDFAVVRYNSDGSLDTTFDLDGKVVTAFGSRNAAARSVLVQSNGRLLVAGHSENGSDHDFAIARYNSDGSLDTSLGGDGITTVDFNGPNDFAVAMALDGQRRAVVAGRSGDAFALARLRLDPTAPFDYDGDGRTDLSVYRPSNGNWYVARSLTSDMYVRPFLSGVIYPADYDGDGKTDLATCDYSSGQNVPLIILNSSTNTISSQQCLSGDLGLSADFDGDSKADFAAWEGGLWQIAMSRSGSVFTQQWGAAGDRPVPADFDGDGKAELAVWRPSAGRWYVANIWTGAISTVNWGADGDIPVVGDYNADGRADFAVYRPTNSTWYRMHSNDFSIHTTIWGAPNDFVAPGDYDGDGRADAAVFRPSNGTWYIVQSSGGTRYVQFGQNGDTPTPGAFIY